MTEAHALKTALTQQQSNPTPEGFSLLGLHMGDSGAAQPKLLHQAQATVIENPDHTISGRPQYVPGGTIPTPDGRTVIQRPGNTIIPGRNNDAPAEQPTSGSGNIRFNSDGTVSGRATYSPNGLIPSEQDHKTAPTVDNQPVGGQLENLIYYTDGKENPRTYSI
jgi:hypothetical protein